MDITTDTRRTRSENSNSLFSVSPWSLYLSRSLRRTAGLRPNAASHSKLGDEGMSDSRKPRLVGINHVAIEVGNIDEALAWYGRIFDFTLRGRSERNAFVDMGDQFINFTTPPVSRPTGPERLTDDRRRVERRAE